MRALPILLVLHALAACAPARPETAAGRPAGSDAGAGQHDREHTPAFEVDPFWPRPLPNGWLLGSVVGLAVDEQDHVWVVHRPGSIADAERGDCCASAPPVLQFDAEGRLVSGWGGPGAGYDWPEAMHGIAVDRQGQVWLGGSGDNDSHILVFTRTGTFLRQFGRPGARRDPSAAAGEPAWIEGPDDREHFGRVAKILVDEAAGEVYVADGYLNRRVAVLDPDTGEVRRIWGAYGDPPGAEPGRSVAGVRAGAPQFENVHCIERSDDGLLYVCDRFNSRIQVFRPDGEFVAERMVGAPGDGTGAAWDIAFSRDPEQSYVYLADGRSMRIRVLWRETLEEVTAFGAGGRQPGQFFGVHSLGTDSHGNLYTTEAFEGKRLQRFVYKGLRPVTVRDQGPPWPMP